MSEIILHTIVLVVVAAITYYLAEVAQTKIPASGRLGYKVGVKIEALLLLIIGPFIVHDICLSLISLIIGWGLCVALLIVFIITLTTEITICDDCFIYKTLMGKQTVDYGSITKIKKSDMQGKYILYVNNQHISIYYFITGSHEFIKLIRGKIAQARRVSD